jgi:amidase
MSLRAIARRIASRELSPVELTRQMLDRIARIDPILKSYATIMADQALRDADVAAREIGAGRYRGPLHGVPIGVKDLCYTRGVRTMGGTAVHRDFVPDVDATVVARLREAGAVILGKLNLSEGATAGYNPTFDVPLNPWNHDRWPGMSSSGSGVATAAGLCFAAIGTDTGGSIRNPSSANGVVGL